MSVPFWQELLTPALAPHFDPYLTYRAGLSGHITSEVIAQLLPPPGPNTHILICGSIPFNRDMQDELSGLGYNNDMKFTF